MIVYMYVDAFVMPDFGYFQRVIDLGVMTPCEKILQTAMEENAGIKNI